MGNKKTTEIYSYVLRHDTGAAPNPYGGICTLTICKPVIRRTAEIGDWVVGTGSKAAIIDGKKCDLSQHLVYAMRITDKKELKDYDAYCKKELEDKIPDWNSTDWKRRVGDCIYDYQNAIDDNNPILRDSVHKEGNRSSDLGGKNALLSEEFCYFGAKAVLLPDELKYIIKSGPGHKKIICKDLIGKFEDWISHKFEENEIDVNPMLQPQIASASCGDCFVSTCAKEQEEDDKNETEEVVCCDKNCCIEAK